MSCHRLAAHRFSLAGACSYSFAPFFEECDYYYKNPYGVQQLIHGTFMTAAHWAMVTSAGRAVLIGTDALRGGELNVTIDGEERTVGRWTALTIDDVVISTRMLSVSVKTPSWTVNVTAKYIYGQANSDGTPVSWWKETQRKRVDVIIVGAFPQPSAHGIVGQSYRDGRVRNGRQDDYHIPKDRVNELGVAPAMTTVAQAEGAIDGGHKDYWLPSPYATNFTFSAYYGAQRTSAATETREASIVEKGQPY